jgi:hypothetical protein
VKILALIGLLLLYLGPIISAVLIIALLRKRFSPLRILFVLNLIILSIFALCIVYPYYIQGYKYIQNPQPGPPLGLTRFPLIKDFAYLYSSVPLGFVWLASGLSFLVLSEVGVNSKIESSVKTLLALTYSFFILNLHSFDIIGIVLE